MTASLANAVWHALGGPHQGFAEGVGGARRYRPDVSIFGALPDDPTDQDWTDLASLVGPSGVATLFRERVDEPDGWNRAMAIEGVQMVDEGVEPALDPEIVGLGEHDVDEMVALVAATNPGPFERRTFELGGYVGLRDEAGRLVAMAGHRIRVDGWVEVSAVCTAESERGRGLGSRLVRHVVARATDEGDQVMLHALRSNVGAIRLYETLGFVVSRPVEAVGLTPPAAEPVQLAPIC